GGHRISPHFIQRIDNSAGETIYKAAPPTVCVEPCETSDKSEPAVTDSNERVDGNDEQTEENHETAQSGMPAITASAEPLPAAQQIADPRAVYIMHSMLRDVITKGTGRRALTLNRSDLAGKTGTTNEQIDTWFAGFNPDIAATVWIGFDQPQTLGRNEFGASTALPV